MTEAEKEEAIAGVAQFYGTQDWHRWNPLFPQHLLTDGAKYVADTFGAYWLMDAIASHSGNPKADPRIQFWTLRKAGKDGFELIGRNDAGIEPFAKQDVLITDFPTELMPFDVWVHRSGMSHVLLLESEY